MRSGSTGTRTTGVGSAGTTPGSGSGGEVDTDLIGLDGSGGGVSSDGTIGRTKGPDITTGRGSDAFASGPPARGGSSEKAKQKVRGTTHNAETTDDASAPKSRSKR